MHSIRGLVHRTRNLTLAMTVAVAAIFVSPRAGLSSSTTISIPGDAQWTDTGIDVAAGQSVSVSASGSIYIGALSAPFTQYDYETPSGSGLAESGACADLAGGSNGTALAWPLNGVPCWSLIGSIGSPGSNPFEVGAMATFAAPVAGRLYLEPNDNYLPDNFRKLERDDHARYLG